jgi:phosphate transport system protein
MADYAVSTIRYFVNNDGKISQNIRDLLGDSINNATTAIKKIFHALRNKTAMEAYKISTQADKLFREKYSEGLKQLSTILKNSTVDEIVALFQNAIIIMKHAERIVDHAINVSENFVFIKQNDFFFDKQNKQFDK